jgi:peroxiredoxin
MRLAGEPISVAYLSPGSPTSPAHGTDTLLADAEEHRAFRNSHEQITAHEVMVLGISSQPAAKLHEALTANCLCHPLASEMTLSLAELLKLPMFRDGSGHFYERLTIIITAGKITQVFYPVPLPGRHAEEVLAHLEATQ